MGEIDFIYTFAEVKLVSLEHDILEPWPSKAHLWNSLPITLKQTEKKDN